MAKASKNSEREALIAAVAAEAIEGGCGDLSVERIAARAGLPASVFEASFPDPKASLAITHDALCECFFARLALACRAQSSWPLKVKVGIAMALDLAAAAPLQALFLIQEPLAVDPALARRATECRDRFARLLAAGRAEALRGSNLPGITEQALVGGLTGVISGRLINGEAEHLPALASALVDLTLRPYLGAEAAAGVASRPRPRIEDL